jgi:hypothetical protein
MTANAAHQRHASENYRVRPRDAGPTSLTRTRTEGGMLMPSTFAFLNAAFEEMTHEATPVFV